MNECNQTEADSQIGRNKLIVNSVEGREGHDREGDKEIQTTRYKIRYKNVMHSTGSVASVL